jgi:uncharacterized protein (UPF0332 family)
MDPIVENGFGRAEDSYADAKLLLEHQRYSGCINRCYYAVFYLVQSLLLSRNVYAKTHSGVIKKFSELFIQTGEFPERIISLYRSIFEKRQVADYNLGYQTHEDEAEKVLSDAREFLDSIRQLLTKSL